MRELGAEVGSREDGDRRGDKYKVYDGKKRCQVREGLRKWSLGLNGDTMGTLLLFGHTISHI